MTFKAEIVEASIDSYQGKRGLVKTHVLTLLDRSEGPRLKNTVDLMLTDEQAEKLPNHDGKLSGKTVQVGVTEIAAGFGGRMRLRGVLLSDIKP